MLKYDFPRLNVVGVISNTGSYRNVAKGSYAMYNFDERIRIQRLRGKYVVEKWTTCSTYCKWVAKKSFKLKREAVMYGFMLAEEV